MAMRGIRLPRQLAQAAIQFVHLARCLFAELFGWFQYLDIVEGSSSSSAPASSQPGAKDADLVFANLSKTIHRGFKFDRMFESDDLDPQSLLELDQMALVSMKTQDAPRNIMEKIVRLLRDFGQKKDLQRYGRYMLKRQRSRTSTEIPAVLPSAFLPEGEGEGEGPIAKLRKNPAFKDLFDHAGVRNLDDSAMRRLAMAHMQDRRHVLYQMFWSPEAALTYLAPAPQRVLPRRAPDFQPFRVMDYGAGPTPSLAAVQEIWPGVIEYATAIEPSEHMTQLGKYLMTDLDMPPIHWQPRTQKTSVKGQESRDALVKRLWSRRMLRVLPFYAFLQLTLAGEGVTKLHPRLGWDLPPRPVDIVIPAGCRADNYLLGEHATVGGLTAGLQRFHRDADHDQMLIFTLQSIQRKTTWIDRCSLFAHPSPSKKAMVRFRREEAPDELSTASRKPCSKALLLELDAAFPELEVYHQAEIRGFRRSARPRAARKRAQQRPTRHEENEVSKPTTVKTFFYGMKPRYPPGKGHALYANRSIVERLDAEAGAYWTLHVEFEN
ncbi:hypothetical protein AK812_SmicGene926 [Symbiodinium microadriaticum]|uniref:Uncharacterized protein n=1 Tax=Symbiodinium microadriaticum TaxID=2951 RepID=A0A1Q9F5G7_SYMMI|nr:hypothetical protein AK812_SmicGene926 [Symbiodinium microadriaticum]